MNQENKKNYEAPEIQELNGFTQVVYGASMIKGSDDEEDE